MCECLDYDDGTRHTCEACVGDLETMREMLAAAERRAEEAEAKYAHIADGYIAAQKLLDDERERVDKWIAYAEQLKEEKGLLHESLNGCAEKLASERAARERAERERESQRSDAVKFHGMLLAAESSLSRATEALREIAGAECLRDEIMDCRAVAPDRPGKWCLSCTARAALAEVGK